jgi:hypothetical protein
MAKKRCTKCCDVEAIQVCLKNIFPKAGQSPTILNITDQAACEDFRIDATCCECNIPYLSLCFAKGCEPEGSIYITGAYFCETDSEGPINIEPILIECLEDCQEITFTPQDTLVEPFCPTLSASIGPWDQESQLPVCRCFCELCGVCKCFTASVGGGSRELEPAGTNTEGCTDYRVPNVGGIPNHTLTSFPETLSCSGLQCNNSPYTNQILVWSLECCPGTDINGNEIIEVRVNAVVGCSSQSPPYPYPFPNDFDFVLEGGGQIIFTFLADCTDYDGKSGTMEICSNFGEVTPGGPAPCDLLCTVPVAVSPKECECELDELFICQENDDIVITILNTDTIEINGDKCWTISISCPTAADAEPLIVNLDCLSCAVPQCSTLDLTGVFIGTNPTTRCEIGEIYYGNNLTCLEQCLCELSCSNGCSSTWNDINVEGGLPCGWYDENNQYIVNGTIWTNVVNGNNALTRAAPFIVNTHNTQEVVWTGTLDSTANNGELHQVTSLIGTAGIEASATGMIFFWDFVGTPTTMSQPITGDTHTIRMLYTLGPALSIIEDEDGCEQEHEQTLEVFLDGNLIDSVVQTVIIEETNAQDVFCDHEIRVQQTRFSGGWPTPKNISALSVTTS